MDKGLNILDTASQLVCFNPVYLILSMVFILFLDASSSLCLGVSKSITFENIANIEYYCFFIHELSAQPPNISKRKVAVLMVVQNGSGREIEVFGVCGKLK